MGNSLIGGDRDGWKKDRGFLSGSNETNETHSANPFRKGTCYRDEGEDRKGSGGSGDGGRGGRDDKGRGGRDDRVRGDVDGGGGDRNKNK